MKKRWITLAIILVVIVGLLIVFTNVGKKSKDYKIGAILPLTGSASYLGKNIQKGMELAQEEINNAGGINSVPLNIIFEDSMNDPKTGVSSYEKLVNNKSLNAIIVAMSTVTNAIIPLAKRDKIPLLCTAVSASGISKQSQWVFRFFTKADDDAKIIAEYSYNNLNLRNVSIIHIQDDFGLSYADVFENTFEELNGEISSVQSFSHGETNFRSQLTKIKSYNPDGVYIIAYANTIALIPKQLRKLGIDCTILSTGTISQNFVVQQAPEAIEGTYYTTNAFNTFNPKTDEMKKFVTSFEDKYNTIPEYFEVFGYDSINLITKAIENQSYTKEGIKKGLLDIHGYQGIAGEININDDGEVNFPLIVAKVENSKPSKPLLLIKP